MSRRPHRSSLAAATWLSAGLVATLAVGVLWRATNGAESAVAEASAPAPAAPAPVPPAAAPEPGPAATAPVAAPKPREPARARRAERRAPAAPASTIDMTAPADEVRESIARLSPKLGPCLSHATAPDVPLWVGVAADGRVDRVRFFGSPLPAAAARCLREALVGQRVRGDGPPEDVFITLAPTR